MSTYAEGYVRAQALDDAVAAEERARAAERPSSRDEQITATVVAFGGDPNSDLDRYHAAAWLHRNERTG